MKSDDFLVRRRKMLPQGTYNLKRDKISEHVTKSFKISKQA